MRIAQVSPLFESVPPQGYGGTERVVHYLTEALVRHGHDVTLFASGDSQTSARLVPCAPRSLRGDGHTKDAIPHHLVMIERVLQRWSEFDLVHFHIDTLHFPSARRGPGPSLTTLHGRLDLPDLEPLYREFRDLPLVSISDAQRAPLPFANWVGTVPHGLPPALHRPGTGQGGYLAFLGRISPEKGPDRAIEIARRAGMPLRIAAKVDDADAAYFAESIEPLLDDRTVKFIGEVSEQEKCGFLGNAAALLFPIDWPEPFGLVMIEAFACGTPVIAFPCGSVPEVMVDGETGFVVESVDEAVAALKRLPEISRRRCREVFERRFTAEHMARGYVEAYESLVARVSGTRG